MLFTYDGYFDLVQTVFECGYEVTDYLKWEAYDKCVILRHDIDNDLQQALSLARLEQRHGVRSTYFVLLTSNFYNPFSERNREILKEIKELGHYIGLHFDETAYPDDVGNADKAVRNLQKEVHILTDMLETDIVGFSYHRPSKAILDADIKIEGLINSYGSIFFRDFKYLSDSRRYWREPVLDIIKGGAYQHLHILTHPFWYHKEEWSIKQSLTDFVERAGRERYDSLDQNITNLGEVLG